MAASGFWKRCNTCKTEIGYSSGHYVCSVSTCHRKGTDFVFCSVECWEAHVPLFRHRDAWAEERQAPPPVAAAKPSPPVAAAKPSPPVAVAKPSPPVAVAKPSPPVAVAKPSPPVARPPSGEPAPLELRTRETIPEEILVVASKLKAYIRARSGMNTSDGVLPRLSRILRDLCDDAIERAHSDGRKTVMDRDLP